MSSFTVTTASARRGDGGSRAGAARRALQYMHRCRLSDRYGRRKWHRHHRLDGGRLMTGVMECVLCV